MSDRPTSAKLMSTDSEIMVIAASRELADEIVCFVGIGLPSVAANLARATHAKNIILVYESGTIGAKPEVLPLSIGDNELAETADVVVSVPEIFNYWLQAGRIDVGFLGAAQIDRYANINTTVIGDYEHPDVRLPGAGGAPDIAASAAEVLIVLKHTKRGFVENLDFVTSIGHLPGQEGGRKAAGLQGAGPKAVITDLGILRPDPATNELVLTSIHPGVTREDVIEKTGWPLKIAEDVATTPPPSDLELGALQSLYVSTDFARKLENQIPR